MNHNSKSLLKKILKNSLIIQKLQKENEKIKKEFKENNTPLFKIGEQFKFQQKIFQIVKIDTNTFNLEIQMEIMSSLNNLENIREEYGENQKLKEKIKNMIIANNGLMFIYIMRECGKNFKINKRKINKYILTEYELKEKIQKI